jgi:uncharacterized membrane protein YhhN
MSKPSTRSTFTLFFIGIVAMVLLANVTQSFTLYIIFKPLIVISLLVHLYFKGGNKAKAVIFAVIGLFLSLVGDVLLVFEGKNPLFFMGGLISFLIAHIFYIFYYSRSSEAVVTKELKGKNVFILLFVLYGIAICAILSDKLGPLRIPVFLYTSVLISMNIFALNRYGRVNDQSFQLIITGAIFFALSDNLLAVNKFMWQIPLAGVWIISTYAAAQYFITKGVLLSFKKQEGYESFQSQEEKKF